jgi:hypothetical protein
LHRDLDKERILYESGADPYDRDTTRDAALAKRIFALFDTYESHVLAALNALTDGESAAAV